MVVPFTDMGKSKEGAGLEREVQEFNFRCSKIYTPVKHLNEEIKQADGYIDSGCRKNSDLV